MDLFRFSALFRIFAIFFFLLAAGMGLDHILSNEKSRKRLLGYFVIILLIFGVIQFLLLFRIEKWQFKQLLFLGFSNFDKHVGAPEKIFLQGLLQMGIVFIIILFLKFRPKKLAISLVCLSCADMILSTQLNIHATVVSDYPAKKANMAFSKFPEGYPTPSLQLPMVQTNNDALNGSVPYLWQNLAIYHKLPSCDGNSPYGLYTMNTAMKNKNYQATLNYPLLFFASFKDRETVIDTSSIDKKSYEKIQITAFNPNQLTAKVTVDKPQYLVLQQNYYPYWIARVNGKEQPVIQTNDTYISVPVRPWISEISFSFRPVKVIWAFYVSLGSFILCMVFIFYRSIKPVFYKG
ncbi:MAG TPA: YfhO family protein, partial [Bacteroidales bacterium]